MAYELLKRMFFFSVFLLGVNLSYGQVGIGTDLPNEYAALDIKSDSAGILIPRVSLGSSYWDIKKNQECNGCNQPSGLIVFNKGGVPVDSSGDPIPGAVAMVEGLYYWSADSVTPTNSRWMILKGSTSVAGYANLSCGEAYLDPEQVIRGEVDVSSGTVIRIPYTAGNGGLYQGVTLFSEGNPDVTAVIPTGQFEEGSGMLTFQLKGTPNAAQASPNGITFDLTPFYNVNGAFAGQSGLCTTVTVGKEVRADIKTVAVMDNLKLTADGGVTGYATQATTPDGKFSIRAIIVDNIYNSAAATFGTDNRYGMNLQIRNNTNENVTILGNYTYLFRGSGGNTSNAIILQPGKWSGDSGLSLDNQTTPYYANFIGTNRNVCDTPSPTLTSNSCVFPHWGNNGVYASGSPEHRIYAWTVNDGTGETSKTAYIMDFMMGGSNPTQRATPTTCGDGVCRQTKVYFKIDQINAVQ